MLREESQNRIEKLGVEKTEKRILQHRRTLK